MSDNWKESLKMALKSSGYGMGGFLIACISGIALLGPVTAAAFGAVSVELTLIGLASGAGLVVGIVMMKKAKPKKRN